MIKKMKISDRKVIQLLINRIQMNILIMSMKICTDQNLDNRYIKIEINSY